jgi:predicted lipoprotein with Yx(FWY)xxD motif
VRKLLVLAALAAVALAGCGTSASSSGSGSASGAAAAGGSSSSSGAVLTTWESPVGQIVVTADGRAVYVFDKDTGGSAASACTGSCVGLWPAVTTTSSSPAVDGVSGDVGTQPTADGKQQLTLDGHRLYTYAGDSGSQQVNGQGFMGIWWLVSPDGQKLTATAGSSSSSAPVQAPSY